MSKIIRNGVIPVLAVCCPVCHSLFETKMALSYVEHTYDDGSVRLAEGPDIKIETEKAHMFADEDCICGTDIISHVTIKAVCPLCENVFDVHMDLEPTSAMLLLPEEEEDEDIYEDDILRSEVDDDAGREVRGESADGDPGEEGS